MKEESNLEYIDLIEEIEESEESEDEIIEVNVKEKNKSNAIKNNKKGVKLHSISSKLKILNLLRNMDGKKQEINIIYLNQH